MRPLPPFHLAAFMIISCASLALFTSAPAAARDLTFDERVSAQEAIERVYYSHQIGATRPFDEAISRAMLEGKVSNYLRESDALERDWETTVTADMLESELNNIAARTQLPSRLREVYSALGFDSILIQECFVRPVLVRRLLGNFVAYDQRIHAEAREDALRARDALALGAPIPAGRNGRPTVHSIDDGLVGGAVLPERRVGASGPGDLVERPDAFVFVGPARDAGDTTRLVEYRVPKISFAEWWSRSAHRLDPMRAVHTAAAEMVLPMPTGIERAESDELECLHADSWDNGTLDDVPDPRSASSVVWTGTEMIVWGGTNYSNERNDGGRYDPLIDRWTPISLDGAPSGRVGHSATWTGSEMLIWGGNDNFYVNTGGRYDPWSDSWTAIPTLDAPSARVGHTAIWTGSRLIVWGGNRDLTSYFNDGGFYDPVSDAWTPIASTGAPASRSGHVAQWTGTEMVVWGGRISVGELTSTGGRFDPSTGSWTTTSTAGAPSPRTGMASAWTGVELLIWGSDSVYVGGGARYDPVHDSWAPISTADGPGAREGAAFTWTGSALIVWGGWTQLGTVATGARYDPSSDAWSQLPALNAPSARMRARAVWADDRVLVWGGQSGDVFFNTGARYDPMSDSWTPMDAGKLIPARRHHTAVWTGNAMIVWGGSFSDGYEYMAAGYSFDAISATWQPLSASGEPTPRVGHTAVWTGEEMIVWGGDLPSLVNSGGRYSPASDAWTPTSTVGVPALRGGHVAVWTGQVMVVWGGENTSTLRSGGRYSPATNTWVATSTSNAPTGRLDATVVWTGSRMIVWGGGTDTGGMYDPVGDAWSATSLANAPTARTYHSAVWTGSRMFVWGGRINVQPFWVNTGALFDPATNAWTATSVTGAPSPRGSHSAVWAGRAALVWAGDPGNPGPLDTGGRFYPDTNQWLPITSDGSPERRRSQTAVWTGEEMIIWGGVGSVTLNSGGRYYPEGRPDIDDDGQSPCDGDCDDTRSDVLAGSVEVCDALDNDCDGTVDGFATTCGLGECHREGLCAEGSDSCAPGPAFDESCDGLDNNCDGSIPSSEVDEDVDSVRVCGGDCDDGDPTVYPLAPEVNDGAENQCPGDPGFGAVDEMSGVPWFTPDDEPIQLCWSAQAGALEYESLRSDSPEFDVGCVREMSTDPCVAAADSPPAGRIHYYLLRPSRLRLGSWGLATSGERVGLCGGEICNDDVDNDGDASADCADQDCAFSAPCRVEGLATVDHLYDDLAPNALDEIFTAHSALASDYIHFRLTSNSPAPFEWCAERADIYREAYIGLASSGGTMTGEGWSVWYRIANGEWIGPSPDYSVNYYGSRCFGVGSWCSEVGVGGRAPSVDPGNENACEARDAYYGCGDGSWTLELSYGPDRVAVCGF